LDLIPGFFMPILQQTKAIAIVILVLVSGWLLYRRSVRRHLSKLQAYELPVQTSVLLEKHVRFYRELPSADQAEFRERVRDFLARTAITAVGNVRVDDTDCLLVASSAIIPIFHFKGWRYNNISEVLLYEGTFSKEFQTEGEGRNVLGMVGDGAMHRQMILSKPALRQGFLAHNDGNNTGIHEFVHLLDKADGATDGLPEYLMGKELYIPWLKEMHAQMELIRAGQSDINTYAATNEAEFLAVTAAYFFEKPAMLQEHHPALYDLLDKMFKGNS